MTLFVRLLDVPVDDKAERLRTAVRGEGGISLHRAPSDMANVPGAAFVYWLQPALLDMFQVESRWDEFDSRCGLGTLDDFRFLRLWWEVPPKDQGWVPFAKGGRFSPFNADIILKLNWHGGAELKASVERKVGSASRKVQGQEFYFREGITWPRLPHILGSFQFMPQGCIYSDGGPGIFAQEAEALGPLCSILNSAPFLFLLECLMPRGSEGGQTLKYEAGYITSVPYPKLNSNLSTELSALSIEGWNIGQYKLRSSETSLWFERPVSPSDHELLDARLAKILATCDALAAKAFNLDEACISEIEIWARNRRSQATLATGHSNEGTFRSAYLSWCVGQAFGRFRPVGPEADAARGDRFDALPDLPPACVGTGGDEAGIERDILVDDVGHPDDIVTAMAPFVSDDAGGIISFDVETLRTWLAKDFFAEHISRYSSFKRKAPIYWQLATPTASYSIWLYFPTLTSDTLYRAYSDYVRPKFLHERGTLEKMHEEFGGSMSSIQRKSLERQQKFVNEMQVFAEDIRKLTPIWEPKPDDGVIINFAPLWRLVGHNKSWQKELASNWQALSEGKRDWAGIALRLWPERVVPACADDRSLAIAHGLEANFWEKNDSGKWAAKLFPDRSMEDIVTDLSVPAVREALAELQTPAEPEVPGRKTRRRS